MSDSSHQHSRPKHDRSEGGELASRGDFSGWRGRRLGFAVALLATVLAVGCHREAAPKAKVVEVVVTTPIADEVTDYQDFTGRLDALKTVDVRPRVSGYVQKALLGEGERIKEGEGRRIKEGDVVREGELLFEVDPRTYQADFNLAEANLRQAEAERKLQMKNAERGRQLIANRNIGQEEYDQILANRDKAIATVGSMTAARDRAKLYLEYTKVIAPLSGRISRRMVDPGNLVNADTTILTTIVTEDPVYAYFDVDERTYLELGAVTSARSQSWFSALKFPVLMRVANEEEFTRKGEVNFLDNRLNANTGTVRMRGVFQNPKGMLKSGLFVRIRLPLGIPYKTLLIPDEALLSDQGRKYVYVVNDKNEVEYRSVSLGQAIQGLRVIKEGLSADDRVIVSGMQRVRTKLHVEAKMQEPPKPPKSSLTKLLAENRGQGSGVGGQKTDRAAP